MHGVAEAEAAVRFWTKEWSGGSFMAIGTNDPDVEGPIFAAEIRRKKVDRIGAFTPCRRRFDKVHVKVKAVQHDLWRAVDHGGEVVRPTPPAHVEA